MSSLCGVIGEFSPTTGRVGNVAIVAGLLLISPPEALVSGFLLTWSVVLSEDCKFKSSPAASTANRCQFDADVMIGGAQVKEAIG